MPNYGLSVLNQVTLELRADTLQFYPNVPNDNNPRIFTGNIYELYSALSDNRFVTLSRADLFTIATNLQSGWTYSSPQVDMIANALLNLMAVGFFVSGNHYNIVNTTVHVDTSGPQIGFFMNGYHYNLTNPTIHITNT